MQIGNHIALLKDLNLFLQSSQHLHRRLNKFLYRRSANATLQRGVIHGQGSIVQNALCAGADAQLQFENGGTSLSRAASGGYEDITKLLLGHEGVDPNSKTTIRETPLCLAARNGHLEVVKALLSVDCVDKNAQTSSGESPLSLAAQNGHLGVIECLLSNDDVDVNITTKTGESSLTLQYGMVIRRLSRCFSKQKELT